jgi:hypothetical protein
MAGDCLPPGLDESLLTRKLPHKFDLSATITNPKQTMVNQLKSMCDKRKYSLLNPLPQIY